ncbi:MAG: QueT transporter family protein [Synergistaceae bacterium]|jgi:uncharacterized membrane protein|nr:QueT transporter family protein [Synergistaceae bacterium]
MNFRRVATGAMIAAVYAAVTMLLAPISYGPVQFRVSEALTLLPFYLPEAIPGLFIGCVLANFLSAWGVADVLVGGSATLLAAYLTRKMPRLWLAALPPVLVNMVFIGALLHVLASVPLWSTMLYVGLGQAGACYLLGYPLMRALEARGVLKNPQSGEKPD